ARVTRILRNPPLKPERRQYDLASDDFSDIYHRAYHCAMRDPLKLTESFTIVPLQGRPFGPGTAEVKIPGGFVCGDVLAWMSAQPDFTGRDAWQLLHALGATGYGERTVYNALAEARKSPPPVLPQDLIDRLYRLRPHHRTGRSNPRREAA